MLYHGLHILGGFTFSDADAVRPAGHRHPDVLLPVGGVQTVDAHNPLHPAVVHRFQGVIEGKAGGVLLVFGDSVLQIQQQAVGLVDVSVLQQRGALGVEEHHGAPKAAQSLFLCHLMAPPQG